MLLPYVVVAKGLVGEICLFGNWVCFRGRTGVGYLSISEVLSTVLAYLLFDLMYESY